MTKSKVGNRDQTSEGKDLKIVQLFKLMVKNNASDLHLIVGAPPVMRVHGVIVRVKLPDLESKTIKKLVDQVLSREQKEKFAKNIELDFSFGIKKLARFRGHVFYSKGAISATFRLIPNLIPDFKTLNLPQILLRMTDISFGLILVTGPTGVGKTTTLASLLDRINSTRSGHIVTLEDPIEYIHNHKSSIVNQREVGLDTPSFVKGMRGLLRQDPDVVLVGELRDLETIKAALEIAETGHLVFGTLHTNSSVQSIQRLVNVFPEHQQDQIRTLLSFVLQGVVSQVLVPNKRHKGRSLAMEILIPNLAIKNLIRENKIHQIYSQMQVGQDGTGMMTLNQCLKKLIDSGKVDAEVGISYSNDQEELLSMLYETE